MATPVLPVLSAKAGDWRSAVLCCFASCVFPGSVWRLTRSANTVTTGEVVVAGSGVVVVVTVVAVVVVDKERTAARNKRQ